MNTTAIDITCLRSTVTITKGLTETLCRCLNSIMTHYDSLISLDTRNVVLFVNLKKRLQFA